MLGKNLSDFEMNKILSTHPVPSFTPVGGCTIQYLEPDGYIAEKAANKRLASKEALVLHKRPRLTSSKRHYHSHASCLPKEFYNPIPSTYISSKGLPIQLYFRIFQLDSFEFTSRIRRYVPVDFVYTVFIKVRYNVDEFYMAGNQFGFNYSCESDIKGLFIVVSNKLEEYMNHYNLRTDAIVYIQISFRQKDKKLLSEFL